MADNAEDFNPIGMLGDCLGDEDLASFARMLDTIAERHPFSELIIKNHQGKVSDILISLKLHVPPRRTPKG